MTDFTITKHAMKRALDMCIDGEEIRAAMLNPRDVVKAGPGKHYLTRGRITCLVSTDGPIPTVISILWARMADWVRDQETIQSRESDDHAQHAAATRAQIKRRKHHTHRSQLGRNR
jgi:hypothetical protein